MSHKKEVHYWVVKHVDGCYLIEAEADKPRWQWVNGHVRRDRFALKVEAIAAREKMRVSEKRCEHTAQIVKVTVRR